MNVTQKVRLGVLGLGRAFTLMLPTFQQDARIELVAACDSRESARAQFARDFNAPTYATVEELVSNTDVEAVYIASPHQFHAAHTGIAAAHGKHVLVEKPMAITLAECDAMIVACATANVHLIVGHCHSFDTPYLQTRDLIERGELGRLRMIQALQYTDFLYRPRRPEELDTALGGGVVFSQAAHQVDVVRLIAGSAATRVRAMLGRWDKARPTEGAYSAMLWFEDGVFASLTYNGYGHFDSDEWCDWSGETGYAKSTEEYGQARKKLARVGSSGEEANLKNAATYGGPLFKAAENKSAPLQHQHFGPIIVSCELGDVRPMPDSLLIYENYKKERRPLIAPAVPRFEVIDELFDALRNSKQPRHSGPWARATAEVCLAMLQSAKEGRDIALGQH